MVLYPIFDGFLKCDQICLHIGTNDLKSKEPNVVADAIVDLAREIENST